MNKQENETVLNIILISCVIGVIIILGVIMFYPNSADNFTSLYFSNGNQYTKIPVDGKIYFNFTIENHENKNSTYFVDYLIDDSIVDHEVIELEKDTNMNFYRKISLNDMSVHKIAILLNKDSDYEIHFWTST
jgi:uncharacterized membrane protein